MKTDNGMDGRDGCLAPAIVLGLCYWHHDSKYSNNWRLDTPPLAVHNFQSQQAFWFLHLPRPVLAEGASGVSNRVTAIVTPHLFAVNGPKQFGMKLVFLRASATHRTPDTISLSYSRFLQTTPAPLVKRAQYEEHELDHQGPSLPPGSPLDEVPAVSSSQGNFGNPVLENQMVAPDGTEISAVRRSTAKTYILFWGSSRSRRLPSDSFFLNRTLCTFGICNLTHPRRLNLWCEGNQQGCLLKLMRVRQIWSGSVSSDIHGVFWNVVWKFAWVH